MDALKLFYDNTIQREAVQFFLEETLKEIALNKLFKGEDASHVALAKSVVDEAFIKLSEMYEPLEEVNTINQAR